MRASDRAYQSLRDDIVNWRIEPGTVLGEVEQAARLGVSRTPLREALSRLNADGLVVAQPGRGHVISPISLENITELYEVRQALEQQAARLCALRRDPEVFAGLSAEFAAVPGRLAQDDESRSAYYSLVRRLDDAIDEGARNSHLVQAIQGVRTHLERIRRIAKGNNERLLTAAHEHQVICDAIRDGNAELAASATHLHLHNSLENVLQSVSKSLLAAGNVA